MPIKQITIFLENKPGRLNRVMDVLREEEINIRAMSIADTIDFGILRLIVNKPEKAIEVLKEAKMTVSETGVLAAAVEDQPGGLAFVLNQLADEGINIEYIYAFVEKSGNNAVVVLRVEEMEKAERILKDNEIDLLDEKRVYAL